jgi:transcriptional regulator with XRE-family HTH domain
MSNMTDKKNISENQKRFIELVQPTPSNTKERMKERHANRYWLRESARIAIEVLVALHDRGWKQADLARKLGVSEQQVSKWVKGTENFTLETLVKLERALDIQIFQAEKKASRYRSTKGTKVFSEETDILPLSATEEELVDSGKSVSGSKGIVIRLQPNFNYHEWQQEQVANGSYSS